MLPSEALHRATVKDLEVMSVAVRYEVRQRRLADPVEAIKVKTEDAGTKYTEDHLIDLVKRAKEKGKRDANS